MIAYQKEKIENAICFFASEYKYKTGKFLYSTYLYKFLAFLDFECIKNHGRPVVGLTYMAMERGPVPLEIYENRGSLKTDCFEFKAQDKDQTKFLIIPKGDPDLDFFSNYEIEEMYRLVEIYADNFVKTKDISDASHESIMAWRRAYRRQPNSIIDYRDEFPGDIKSKNIDDLSPEEESLVFFMSLQKISK